MMEVGIALAGMLVLVVIGVFLMRLDIRNRAVKRMDEGEYATGANSASQSSSTGDTVPLASGSAVLEQSKLAVHALLQEVSESVDTLTGDSSKYGHSLDAHRTAIRKVKTVANLQELERTLLSEIDAIQGANAQYQCQLDSANDKVKMQQKELERLQTDANIDFLTKIPNRRTFDKRLAEEMSRAKRYEGIFAMIVVDVDHFKCVNDRYGHLAGDRILRAIAQLLDENKRESDFLARFGGEEFVLLLPETSTEQAIILAENIRKKLERSKFRFEKKVIRVTISAGVGEIVPKNDKPVSLFARVDAALYRAKEGGRNRVVAEEKSA